MGFADLFRRAEKRSTGNETLAALGAHWLGTPSSKYPAEQLAVTAACVQVIAGQLAGLPVHVYRFEGDKRVEHPSHPFACLVRRGPNAWQSWPSFVEWMAASALLTGNALAEIVADRAGRVVELRPIRWGLVRVELVNPGKVIYHVTGDDLSGKMGTTRRLLARDVIHLRARTDDGVIGIPPLRRAMAAADHATETDSFSKSWLKNSAVPSGVLKHEKTLSEGAATRLKSQFMERFGGSKKGSTLVLEEGLDWQQFDIPTAETSELLASRKFSTSEIARSFCVPEPLVGIMDKSSFTNSETLLRFFAQGTLSYWARNLECELQRSVLTDAERETFEIEVSLDGLLRGDSAARWAAWKIALDAGVLTKDEVRGAEGWSPLGEADAPEGEGIA